jgi:hypothetical protein
MPRYRLRTLLIVIAVVAIPLARIAYLKQMARINRQAAEQLVNQLSDHTGSSEAEIQISVQKTAQSEDARKAQFSIPRNATSKMHFTLPNGHDAELTLDGTSREMWRRAVVHTIVAERYDRAVYRPWTLVKDSLE